MDWDAQETLGRVYDRIERERLFFGATIVIEDLIRQEDGTFIKWLSNIGVRPATALATIESSPYNQVAENQESGCPTQAGIFLLNGLSECDWVNNVELGHMAVKTLAGHSRGDLRDLLFGKQEGVEWKLDLFGKEFSQAVKQSGWWDFFTDSETLAIRQTLCHISEPIWNEQNQTFVGKVVWFGRAMPHLGEQAVWMLWYLYQCLEGNRPFAMTSEINAYLRQNIPGISTVRPDKQYALFDAPEIVKREGTKYWLNLPDTA